MPDPLPHERWEHVSNNRQSDEIHCSRKRWNPGLQFLEDSVPQRDSPRSPVSSISSSSPRIEHAHHSYYEVSRDTDSSSHRLQYQTGTSQGLSLGRDTNAISPPPLRKCHKKVSEREESRSKPTSFQIISHTGSQSYRPSYETVRPSNSSRKAHDISQVPPLWNDKAYQQPSRDGQGIRIKGLALSSRIPVPTAVSTVTHDLKDSPISRNKLGVPTLEVVFPTLTYSSSLRTKVSKSSTSEQHLNTTICESARETKIPIVTSTARLAVTNLPVFPAFRKGGTPGSEITSSSKASTLKNQCRNCGGSPEPLHTLEKCQRCPRRYHRSCAGQISRGNEEWSKFVCTRCIRKLCQQETLSDVTTEKQPNEVMRETVERLRMDKMPRLHTASDISRQYKAQANGEIPLISATIHENTIDAIALVQDSVFRQSFVPPKKPAADRNSNQASQDVLSPLQTRNIAIQETNYGDPVSHSRSRSWENHAANYEKEAVDLPNSLVVDHSILAKTKATEEAYKKVTCPWWAKADCHHRASECVFAHGKTNIRTPVGHETNKEWTCYYWNDSQRCPHVDSAGVCLHAHTDTGLYVGIDGRACRKFETCFWWMKSGYCRKEEMCPFAHYPTGRVSEDPANKPVSSSSSRQARPSSRFKRLSLTSIDTRVQSPPPHQQSERSISPAGGQPAKISDPRLKCGVLSEADRPAPDSDKDNSLDAADSSTCSEVPSEDRSNGDISHASNDMDSPKFRRCKSCPKRIFGGERCSGCQSTTERPVLAESDSIVENTDLSVLVSNELGISERSDSFEDDQTVIVPADHLRAPGPRIIKRKAPNERVFQPSKRHKPHFDVATICEKVKPPPDPASLQATLSLPKMTEQAAFGKRLIAPNNSLEVPEVVDSPNINATTSVSRMTPRCPTYSPCPDIQAEIDIDQPATGSEERVSILKNSNFDKSDTPALNADTPLLTNSKSTDADTALPTIKEKTPLWSQSTEESSEEDELLSISAWVRDVSPRKITSGPRIASVVAAPRKISCDGCRHRKKRCTHDTQATKEIDANVRQAIETRPAGSYGSCEQGEELQAERLKDRFAREGSTRSATSASRVSETSHSLETPATSIAPSVDGLEALDKTIAYTRQNLILVKPQTVGQVEPKEALKSTVVNNGVDDVSTQDKSEEEVVHGLRLLGFQIDSDDSDDDPENDRLPQMSDPPRPIAGKSDNVWLPAMTLGQGMKNKDKRAVLLRSMIRNQQMFGNKHYSRESKIKSTEVGAVFERKVYSTRDRLAAPKLVEQFERASFGDFLGLPKDFEPVPTLGPGEGNSRELFMKNRDANEHVSNVRRRRVKATETWPIRGEY